MSEPFYTDDWLTIYQGDCRIVMADMEPDSVDCVVTSPPYWGLRDYGAATWIGGDDGCDHSVSQPDADNKAVFAERVYRGDRSSCLKCGAVRADPTVWGGDPTHEHGWEYHRYYVEGGGGAQSSAEAFSKAGPENAERIKQARWREDDRCECGAWRGALGLEPSPGQYVENLVSVFRQVRRVLKPSGTVWLNLGDTYSSRGGAGGTAATNGHRPEVDDPEAFGKWNRDWGNLKPKDLVGIPWRVAFALQDDGWFLRRDIIWAKSNPMPESVTDRPTSSHEYLFLLTKQPRYYYDAEAVRERGTSGPSDVRKMEQGLERIGGKHKTLVDPMAKASAATHIGTHRGVGSPNRNLRSVWNIATVPYPGAHFAVFPPALVEPCVKAGSSERGVCPECGKPWVRVVERTGYNGERADESVYTGQAYEHAQSGPRGPARNFGEPTSTTTGWRPSCAHGIASWEDMELIASPTGERAGEDPSLVTGRAGMNRPRGDNEGKRLITRYEQRLYAVQLKASPFRREMVGDAGLAFRHYIRTDRAGARPVPGDLLERWIRAGYIKRIEPPVADDAPEPVPAAVLDPFAGSGTVGLVANRLSRRATLIDLNGDYLRQQMQRNAQTPLGLK